MVHLGRRNIQQGPQIPLAVSHRPKITAFWYQSAKWNSVMTVTRGRDTAHAAHTAPPAVRFNLLCRGVFEDLRYEDSEGCLRFFDR